MIDEKAIMSDQHRLFQSQIEALASNQTNAKTGLNSLSEKVENLSKVVSLNAKSQIEIACVDAQ